MALDVDAQNGFLAAAFDGDLPAVARYFTRSDVLANTALWDAVHRAERFNEPPSTVVPAQSWFQGTGPDADFTTSVVSGSQVEVLRWLFAHEQLALLGGTLHTVAVDILSTCVFAPQTTSRLEMIQIVLESPLFREVWTEEEQLNILGGILNDAASCGLDVLVDVLLAYGADPNRSTNFDTPLTSIAYKGSPAALDVLLAHGAWLDGMERIVQHVHDGSAWLVDELLRRGADANTVDDEGTSLLHHAGSSCTGRVLRALAYDGYADVDARNQDGGTALLTTASVGVGTTEARLGTPKRLLLEILLDAGADPHAVDRGQRGLLHHVILGWGDAPCLQFVLGLGMNVNGRDIEGRTALATLLERTRGEVFGGIKVLLSHLLQAGGDPYLRNQSGESVVKILESTATGRQFVFENPLLFGQ